MTTPAVTHDRLGRMLPALLVLTLIAAALEGIAALALREMVLATAATSTAVFAVGVVAALGQMRAGRPLAARLALAASLTVFGGFGSYLIPAVSDAVAFVPIVSVVLVLPYMPRGWLIPVIAVAVGCAIAILALGVNGATTPAIAGPVGVVFEAAIVVGVIVLVLLGLADFATQARDSARSLVQSTSRQMRGTTTRLAIVNALQKMRALASPEATAAHIATALSDLPYVDVGIVVEAQGPELTVLAADGSASEPLHPPAEFPAARAAYLMERSRHGAWAELWPDRPGPGLEDARMTQLGIKAQAFAPILAGTEVVGLVGIATTDADEAARIVAELPFVNEAATVAGAILAPAIVSRQQHDAAMVSITAIIRSQSFHAVFQPIVDLAMGETVGYEALTRFDTGDSPDRMFADAAQVGLGLELEAITLAAALRDAAHLPPAAWLSLNVSPRLLAERVRLTGLLADRTRPIMLEITEHEIIENYAVLHASMRTFGPDVRLAVDDAGAGIANFRHLVELRPNLVKIDAALIRGVNADVSRQALIVGFVHFAAVSGALVLAEGLETVAEQETVQRLGVSLGQGYLIGRPAPVDVWASPSRRVASVSKLAEVIPISAPRRAGRARKS